jgi:hypothetical protein
MNTGSRYSRLNGHTHYPVKPLGFGCGVVAYLRYYPSPLPQTTEDNHEKPEPRIEPMPFQV